MVQALQIAFTSLYNSAYSFFLLGHSTQFLMQRIGRIIRFNHRIRRKFEGGLYLDSRIFLWGDKHFTQTTEKTLLPRACHDGIPMCNDTVLHTLLGHYRVLLGNYLLNVTGGYHAVIRLTQRAQHFYRIGILLAYQSKHAVCPLYIAVISKNKVLHFPVYEKQGKKQYRQQQSVAYGNLYFGDIIHTIKSFPWSVYGTSTTASLPHWSVRTGKPSRLPSAPNRKRNRKGTLRAKI